MTFHIQQYMRADEPFIVDANCRMAMEQMFNS